MPSPESDFLIEFSNPGRGSSATDVYELKPGGQGNLAPFPTEPAGERAKKERPGDAAAEPPQASRPAPPADRDADAAPRKAQLKAQVVGRVDEQKTVISKGVPDTDSDLVAASSPQKLGRALEGRRLGHFLIEAFVGGGGMGAVFRGRDMTLGRTVAVKVLSREQGEDPETLRRFRNEAQSAARLDHENVARVYFVGEDDGWHYIVFEFIEGVNVRDLVVRNGPLPLEEAVNYTVQVAEALAHAERRHVVHRDIKPSNVLVTPNGRAKLVDMGLARLRQVGPHEDQTASGVTLGTFDYISPEQARDPRLADTRSDLYSLGCTFYFMLTGRPPFPEGTVLQKLISHSSDEPPDPRQFRPDLPEDLAAIVNRFLQKRPADRYPHPDEAIGEMLLVAESMGLAIHSGGASVWITPGESPVTPLERQLPWMIPAVLLLLIVFALNFLRDPRRLDDRIPDFEVPAVTAPVDGDAIDANRQAPPDTEMVLPAAVDEAEDPGVGAGAEAHS